MKGTLIFLCVLIAVTLAQHNHRCNDRGDCSAVVCGHNEEVHCRDNLCVCEIVHGKRQLCHEHQHCTCNDGTVSVCGADGTCICHDHGGHGGVGKRQVCHEHQHCTCNDGTVSDCVIGFCFCKGHSVGKK